MYFNIIKFDIFEEIKGMGDGYIQFLIECIFLFFFYIYFRNIKLFIQKVKLYSYLFIVSSDRFVYIKLKKKVDMFGLFYKFCIDFVLIKV